MNSRNLALAALKQAMDLLQPVIDANAISNSAKAIAALEAETGEPVEPIDCQFQGTDGRWHSFLNDQHKDNTIASGVWPIRNLYAAPVPAEPVAWAMFRSDGIILDVIDPGEHALHEGQYTIPLYRGAA